MSNDAQPADDRTDLPLQDLAVVVTGAGRGIGAAYAAHCAELGADVVVNDIDETAQHTVDAIVAAGGRASAFVGSVADPEQAEALVEQCIERHGRIDGLVNNAGLFHAATYAEETPERAAELIRVNVLGTLYCGMYALRRMVATGSGSVVNVTSGTQAGTAGLSTYGASKGAIASLTYAWALEVAGTGVRVNAVSPNAHTRMADQFEAYRGTGATGQNVNKPPADNAPIVAWLLSDRTTGINGQIVRIDGPTTAVMTHPASLEPVAAQGDRWTVDSLEAKFGPLLRGNLQPLGLQVG